MDLLCYKEGTQHPIANLVRVNKSLGMSKSSKLKLNIKAILDVDSRIIGLGMVI